VSNRTLPFDALQLLASESVALLQPSHKGVDFGQRERWLVGDKRRTGRALQRTHPPPNGSHCHGPYHSAARRLGTPATNAPAIAIPSPDADSVRIRLLLSRTRVMDVMTAAITAEGEFK